MLFTKILIANRGEIACRVMKTAHGLGYKTVAVYSDADQYACHTKMATQAIHIGGSPVGESYLSLEKIMAAIKTSGADAVHPGYGFLSENAEFAQACEREGICFIGPSAFAINLMGSKRESKIAMIEAGVPCIPGYEGENQDDDVLVTAADQIGFPIMVKASAGGGGRGMRLAQTPDELLPSIKSGRSEAKNAFGNDELILEKAIINPRHVEIQVFGDLHGNYIHLGERDCSVQRRHQKVIEESPSPVVDEAMREAMGAAAVQAAKSCNYVGAGTVEFIVDESRNSYFLEMNTRLQVEHPVTELVTGLDLVEWQLEIASGKLLPLSQQEVTFKGHAVEVRLYAEDPANDFMPQTGRLLTWLPSTARGIRFDSGVEAGADVSQYYDPMIAKVIAHGDSREQAIRKLAVALEETIVLGVNTNKTFLHRILRHPSFMDGSATTAFVANYLDDNKGIIPDAKDREMPWAVAALCSYLGQSMGRQFDASQIGWRSARSADTLIGLEQAEETAWASIHSHREISPNRKFTVTLGLDVPTLQDAKSPSSFEFFIADIKEKSFSVTHADCPAFKVHFVVDRENIYLDMGQGNISFCNVTHRPPIAVEEEGSGISKAPMDGAVIAVDVKAGDQVKCGQVMAVMEAMKMEHQILADVDGCVSDIFITVGDQIKSKQIIIQVEPEST